jgi:hypothetical protein
MRIEIKQEFEKILQQSTFTKQDIITMLSATGSDEKLLFAKAKEI